MSSISSSAFFRSFCIRPIIFSASRYCTIRCALSVFEIVLYTDVLYVPAIPTLNLCKILLSSEVRSFLIFGSIIEGESNLCFITNAFARAVKSSDVMYSTNSNTFAPFSPLARSNICVRMFTQTRPRHRLLISPGHMLQCSSFLFIKLIIEYSSVKLCLYSLTVPPTTDRTKSAERRSIFSRQYKIIRRANL